jgi:serine/threonine protein phosphatase PrpC
VNSDSLQTRVGFASDTGRRENNEDFLISCEADGARLHETVAVVADGLGGGPSGRFAAESVARGFLDGYLAQPKTLGVSMASSRALAAMNRWLYAQTPGDAGQARPATTLSALVLRGRRAHIVHVGDSRVYRLREGRLQRLTTDHTHKHPDMRHVLFRAVGLEPDVRADYSAQDLRPHDRYLLCSDGVHGALDDHKIGRLLGAAESPEVDARRLVDEALASGSQDNATALVVDVVSVPASDRADLELAMAQLPLEELPRVGDVIDGFRLVEMISDGRYSRLFHAQDQSEARELVLKFPHPRVASDAVYRRAFTREAWVAAQVRSPYVAEVIELPPGRQTRLYSVMPYYRGETLEQRLKRTPAVALKEGVEIGIKLAKAIYALNRLRIIHRDIKPDNVLLLAPDGGAGLKLLDLGVARLPGVDESEAEEIPGTPSFMAPELYDGVRGDERSEVYALGVTLYRMFSGQYPYGEVEAFSTPRFTRYQPLSKYRPDLPAWLDASIARAVAVAPEKRFNEVMEFGFDLENGLARGAPSMSLRRRSLYERNPIRFWQVVSLLLTLALVFSIFSR